MKTYIPKWKSTVMRVGLGVTALFVLGCDRHPEPEPPRQDKATLKLGYRPKALADVTAVCIREADISRPSVKLEFVAVSSPPDGWNKFKSGEVDALAGMPLASVFDQLIGAGPQRKFIAYFLQVDVNGEGWVALVGSKQLGVSSISDLAGKTAATLNTDQAEWLMRRILLAAGVPNDKLNIVRYNPATPLIGLRNGEHAAIFGLEPALSEAVSEGNPILARGPVSHFLYADQPVPVSASVIAVEWTEKDSKAYADFVQIVEDAVRMSRENPEKVRDYFQKTDYGGFKPEITKLLSLPVMAKPSASLRRVTEQYVDDMVRDNVLKQKVDLSPLFPSEK